MAPLSIAFLGCIPGTGHTSDLMDFSRAGLVVDFAKFRGISTRYPSLQRTWRWDRPVVLYVVEIADLTGIMAFLFRSFGYAPFTS